MMHEAFEPAPFEDAVHWVGDKCVHDTFAALDSVAAAFDDSRSNCRSPSQSAARRRPARRASAAAAGAARPPDEFFENPRNDRTKRFLSQILHH